MTAQISDLSPDAGNTEFAVAFSDFIDELLCFPTWSPLRREGRRIPWWSVDAGRNQFERELASAGVYIFGSQGMPMYVGKTTGKLLTRLKNRYIGGPRTQFQLAKTHAADLIEKGLEGFPEDVHKWYEKNHTKDGLRLRHAVEFAKVGIDTVWIALIPISDKAKVEQMEERIIPVANDWNRSRSYPDLLNVQHNILAVDFARRVSS